MTVSHAIEDPRRDPSALRWDSPISLHAGEFDSDRSHSGRYHAGQALHGDAFHGDHAGHHHFGTAVVAPDASAVAAGASATAGAYVAPQNGRLARLIVRMAERSPRWLAPASIAVCFAGVASYVWVSNPTDGGAADLETCLIKLTTGFDCPGCGGTRAFYYLLNGNIPEAARHHAIAVFAAPFLVWLYLAWAIQRTTGRQIPAPRFGARAVGIFLAAWAVFMVLRNLPWAPFTSLYV